MTENLPAPMRSGNPVPRAIFRPLLILTLAVAGGCSLVRRPPPAPEPEPAPPEYEFPHTRVWTAHRDVSLRGDSASVSVPRAFTALTVEDADSLWITVRCPGCDGEPAGRVLHEEVLYEAQSPVQAASGSVAEFALAIRAAAERGDVQALALVMHPEFTFSLVGLQGAERARSAWAADGYEVLERIPELLDGGLAPAGGGLWVAPADFVEETSYSGLRIGFRRSPGGRWEWVFLVRGLGVSGR